MRPSSPNVSVFPIRNSARAASRISGSNLEAFEADMAELPKVNAI